MKQGKAETGNLNQDLFFSHSRFWPYIAFLTKGHVVTLHCNSKLILVHFIKIIDVDKFADLQAQGTTHMHVTKHGVIQRYCITRVHVQKDGETEA